MSYCRSSSPADHQARGIGLRYVNLALDSAHNQGKRLLNQLAVGQIECNLIHLAATDCQTQARDEIDHAREFDLTILGGCCGTDQRYIEALAKEAQQG